MEHLFSQKSQDKIYLYFKLRILGMFESFLNLLKISEKVDPLRLDLVITVMNDFSVIFFPPYLPFDTEAKDIINKTNFQMVALSCGLHIWKHYFT